MPPAQKSPSLFDPSKEHYLIWLLCAVAAAHVVFFSATYPLFIVDEAAHFDLAVKYSHFQLPQKADYYAQESMPYIVVFDTWEYAYTNDTLTAAPWKQPQSVITPILLSREIRWRSINRETSQPPLYYVLSGIWWRLCNAAGFHDMALPYLLRFFNAFIVVALVWLGWFAARLVFPGEMFIHISVPALIALLPQTAFYSIGNDALSPLSFGAAFVSVICWMRAETPGSALGAVTGLALAATFLTKMCNVPLLAVAFLAVFLKVCLAGRQSVARILPSFATLLGCALLPMAAWSAWCKTHFGDFTGSREVVQPLGWTIKPFWQWWHHPIFTPPGLWTFVSGNLATLWQDEKLWHGRPLSLRPVDLFYTLISIAFVAIAVFRLKSADSPRRRALVFALATLVTSFMFFGLLSIVYDFHNCFYPSRQYPYFTSGRLMLGALIPFLLLFVFGLDRALKKWGNVAKYIALVALLLFMLAAEIATDWPIFQSQYNWFHA
jgi:hypothetical protein